MKTKCACRVMSKQQCCKSKVVLLAFLTCNFFSVSENPYSPSSGCRGWGTAVWDTNDGLLHCWNTKTCEDPLMSHRFRPYMPCSDVLYNVCVFKQINIKELLK